MNASRSVRHVAIAVLGVVAMVSLAVPAAASTVGNLSTDGLSPDTAKFVAAVQENPTDFSGLDKLSRELFGQPYIVADENGHEYTGTEAAAVTEKLSEMGSDGVVSPMAFKSDTFAIYIGKATVTGGVYVTGSVIFSDSYATQAAPVDVSSLGFTAPSCVTFSNHQMSTHNVNGVSTGLAWLANANVGAKAPIWNINDHTSGFQDQAAKSAASVLLKSTSCSGAAAISAAYRYEHNQGGSVTGFSASFAGLSVSYGGSSLKLKKSSSVLNFSM